MTIPATVLSVGGLSALIIAIATYAFGKNRIEQKAHQLLSSQSVCIECLETPVLVPGGVCKTCQRIAAEVRSAVAGICLICKENRTLPRTDLCQYCLTDFYTELDNWGRK